MIKNYIHFNESIKDLLKGPTDEEVLNNLKHLTPLVLLSRSCEYGLLSGVKLAFERDKISNSIQEHIFFSVLRVASSNDYYDIIEFLIYNYKYNYKDLETIFTIYADDKTKDIINDYLISINKETL